MFDSRFDKLMQAWGIAYASDHKDEVHQRRREDSHPLAQRMQFAPGKKNRKTTRLAQGRDGRDRRRIQAAAAAIKGLHIIGPEFSDPIRCKETRSVHYQPERAVAPELQAVEKAVKDLEQIPHGFIRSLCLRENYCTQGEQKEKAKRVTEKLRALSRDAEEISVSKFRDECLYGRIWVHGRVYSPKPPTQEV